MSLNYAEVAPDAVSPDFTTTSRHHDADHTTPTTNQQRQQEIVGKGALSLTDTWALLGALRYDLENAQTISDGVGTTVSRRLLDAGRHLRTDQHSGPGYPARATSDGEFSAEISRHLSIADRRFRRVRPGRVEHERLEGESPRPSPTGARTAFNSGGVFERDPMHLHCGERGACRLGWADRFALCCTGANRAVDCRARQRRSDHRL